MGKRDKRGNACVNVVSDTGIPMLILGGKVRTKDGLAAVYALQATSGQSLVSTVHAGANVDNCGLFCLSRYKVGNRVLNKVEE
jgi:hypothetical protein